MRTPGVPEQPKELGPNGGRLCRGCHVEMPASWGKRAAWCSTDCQRETWVRGGWHVRHYAFLRDKGRCALCGADAERAERICAWLRSHWRKDQRLTEAQADAGQAGARLIRELWGHPWQYSTLSLWEADHILPVAEGGGGCGLAGYRTLCRPCHLEVTRELHRRLSRARRAETQPELPL